MTKKELSPLDVYRLLPKTNCRQCGEINCLAFATKVMNREVSLEKCALLKKENAKAYEQLKILFEPAVKEVVIGVGKQAVKIGGKLAMYRHEFAYSNPTAIAIDLTDGMSEEEISSRVKKTERFSYNYIGQTIRLDMIAIRSTTNDADRFSATVKNVVKSTSLPVILCSFNPDVIEAGLKTAPESNPLLYAATEDNWKGMAHLALTYDCPLTVSAPNKLNTLRSLVKTLLQYGVTKLALDPGTYPNNGLTDTLGNFTILRRAACRYGDKFFGFPLVGVPMTAWTNRTVGPEELVKWREAYLGAMLMIRFADLLIMHSVDGWALLPLVILRQNIYTDPRKPMAVKAGLRTFGTPDENSPVMFTANFALTYFTVASDLEKAKISAYLLVVDTEGIAVDSAVAGRKLTAEKVASALVSSAAGDRVKHRNLIIPGKAARLSKEIEELTDWHVLIGPKDSSDIPKFLLEISQCCR